MQAVSDFKPALCLPGSSQDSAASPGDSEHEIVFPPKNLLRKHRLAAILDTTRAEVHVWDGAGYEASSELPAGGSCLMPLARV